MPKSMLALFAAPSAQRTQLRSLSFDAADGAHKLNLAASARKRILIRKPKADASPAILSNTAAAIAVGSQLATCCTDESASEESSPPESLCDKSEKTLIPALLHAPGPKDTLELLPRIDALLPLDVIDILTLPLSPPSPPSQAFSSSSSSSASSSSSSSSTDSLSDSTSASPTGSNDLTSRTTPVSSLPALDKEPEVKLADIIAKAATDASISPAPRLHHAQNSVRKTNSDIDWTKDVPFPVPVSGPAGTRQSVPPLPNFPMRHRAARLSDPTPIQYSTNTFPGHARRTPRRTRSAIGKAPMHLPAARRKMSAVWEEEEGDELLSSGQSPRRAWTEPGDLAVLSRRRSRSQSRTHLFNRRSMPEGQTLQSSLPRLVDISSTLSVSDGGSPSDYGTVVLPRTGQEPIKLKRYSLRFGNDSLIDLTRYKRSQTTMSIISMTKNASAPRPRRASLSAKTEARRVVPAADAPCRLGLTSHVPPPSRVTAGQVMVQVSAVGLDRLDDLIVREKVLRSDSDGFVPGRSFVGRVVEFGFEVNNVSKSDWVIGLLDVRKCGALSEFVVVDRRRLARVPRPSPSLSLEQLALLPLCALPAHRAVRTLDGFDDGARALVLNAHDGAGALALQELVASGVRVTAQISPVASDESSTETHIILLKERVRKWGASEVRVDTPLRVIESFKNDVFDFVVDTIGGKAIWDNCRRVLRSSGQFSTLVGESTQAVPSINVHFKANLRSLTRAFVKKDHKVLGYTWTSPALDVDHFGEDVRDSLIAVSKLAVDGILSPWVAPERCVNFERTLSVFPSDGRTVLKDGRTAVVRVIDCNAK